MTFQVSRLRRELVRRSMNRLGLEVTRHPYFKRLTRLMEALELQAVLDVGANEGQYARALRSSGFRGTVLSVEPLTSAYDGLAKRAASDPAWQVVRAAVSDQPGTLTIHESANSVSSSTLPILDSLVRADPHTAYVSQEEVHATTVDALVSEHGLDPRATFLKIDVQGYETTVLDGAADTLHAFGAVALELALVPLYEGQSLMPELVSRMDECGFDLWMLEQGFWETATSRTLECDGIFVSRERSPDA